MRGKNPIRPPEKGDGSTLFVQDIFTTLQGEGLYAGHPAVFVRLGGCNLACDFCDTEFESFSQRSVKEIASDIKNHSRLESGATVSLVVITGGEPFRQPIETLVAQLVEQGFKVQIETNGTLYRELPPEADIVCSPKNTGQGYGALRADILERANALKFIISETHPQYREVGKVGQAGRAIPIYVQPMDEYDEHKNRQNLMRATKLALENGYRLSIQTHKIAGIP